MREIYLIRHGETDWNHRRIAMGHEDILLNNSGRQQAQQTANRLAQVRPDRIYSSDLSRAAETARIIAGPHNIEPIYDKELREINLKGFVSLPDHELRAAFPHAYRVFGDEQNGLINKPFPETETRFDLLKRTSMRFDSIWTEAGWEKAFIVCHGGVIRSLVSHVFQLQSNFTTGVFYSLAITCDNCSITKIEEDADGKPYFRWINDASHLSEI